MYAREVNGRTLTFAVSGYLLDGSLVMFDTETGSYWSHLLGKAVDGPLGGAQLEQLPAVMTDWETWRGVHAVTTVAMLTRKYVFDRDYYREPSRYVIGAVASTATRAWPFDQLLDQPVVNDQLGDIPLLAIFDPRTSTAILFDRRVTGQTLTFQLLDGQLVDQETGSTWGLSSGRAEDGQLLGQQLELLTATVSTREAWEQFHPESAYFSAD